MDGDTLYSIGELARRTGLTVKTIRFYSDRGIVAPTDRSPAGYRRYNGDAVARLDLVRTLRDLGLDLSTIRRVVDRELALPEVAAAHAGALAVQIRVLRLRHALLTAVAERGLTAEEADVMHRLAQLSEDERRRLIGEFLDAAFGGSAPVPRSPESDARCHPRCPTVPMRSSCGRGWSGPNWSWTRTSAPACGGWSRITRPNRHWATPPPRAAVSPPSSVTGSAPPWRQVWILLPAGPIRSSRHWRPTRRRFSAAPTTNELRRMLLARLESVSDPRRDRYVELLAVINGWPAPESLAPALGWSVQAVRVRMER